MNDKLSITSNTIENLIFEIRGVKVMLDYDLAAIYGVETRTLNQAVKRNIERFPEDFMFMLSDKEWRDLHANLLTTNMTSQFVISYLEPTTKENVRFKMPKWHLKDRSWSTWYESITTKSNRI